MSKLKALPIRKKDPAILKVKVGADTYRILDKLLTYEIEVKEAVKARYKYVRRELHYSVAVKFITDKLGGKK